MRPVDVYTVVNRRQEHSRRAGRSLRRRLGRLAAGLGALLGLLLAGGIITGAFAYTGAVSSLPSLEKLSSLASPQTGALLQPTRLYDRTGQRLLLELNPTGIARRFLQVRASPGDSFSPELVRLAEAAFPRQSPSSSDLTSPAVQTHAEYLASSLLLPGQDSSLAAALRLRLLGWQLSNRYTHSDLLAAYLNTLNFGRYAVGADAAAQLYLGKPASSLSLAESALLLAAAQAPALNPIDSPQAARDLQVDFLYRMVEQGVISEADLRQALDEPLAFNPPPATSHQVGAAFAVRAVEQLERVLGQAVVERGGLVVITSLDYDLQAQLECTLDLHLRRISGLAAPDAPADPACTAARLLPTLPSSLLSGEDLSASAAVLDPASGQLLALAAAASPSGQRDRLQARTPGSLLLPFIYLSGFSHGLSPASLTWDVPVSLDSAAALPEPAAGYQGPLSLRQALARQAVAPATRLLEETGPREIWQLASSFGLPQNLPDLAASSAPALFPWAGARLDLVDILQAYGVFAASGTLAGQTESLASPAQPDSSSQEPARLTSSLILAVTTTSGETLLDWTQPQTRALVSQPLAYLVNSVLSDDAARWPVLGHPNLLETGQAAAALVGETFEGSDAWTAGYTPNRAVVTWVGRDASPESAELKLDWRLSAALWNAVIKTASSGLPDSGWNIPPGVASVDVCEPSGLLPTAGCPHIVTEVFLQGNEPVQADTYLRRVQINRETGLLATIFTPPGLVEEQVFFVVPTEYRDWAVKSGFPQPPSAYDTLQAPAVLENAHISQPAMFSAVSGKVNLKGTASAKDFAYYRLQAGQGINPQEWLQIGANRTDPVENGLLAEWDTSGLSGLYALRLSVVHNDLKVDTAVLQVLVDNQAPQVRVVYPADGQALKAGLVVLQAEASDDGGAPLLDWIIDGQPAAASQPRPYTLPYTLKPGRHTLLVRAVDQAGNLAESPLITFRVE